MPTIEELSELVFVYGNLRKHGCEGYRMEGAERVSTGEVAGMLFAKAGVPGLVPGDSGGCVVGDLYRTSRSHLAELDNGGESANGGRYRRVRVKVYRESSTRYLGEAWTWQLDESLDGARVVKSGDWMDVCRPRSWPCFTLLAVGCMVGFFAVFAVGPPPVHPLRPRPIFPLALFLVSLATIPWVGAFAAWWGLRRRECFPAVGVAALAISAALCVPSLVGIAVKLAEWLGF